MSQEKKIKPIIPKKILIDTTHSYWNSRQKGDKVLHKVEIDKYSYDFIHPADFSNNSQVVKLLKLFRILKFVRNLDLSKLKLLFTSLYLSKVLYLAKRMSKTPFVSIIDSKTASDKYKGLYESWPKYAKRVNTLKYRLNLSHFSFFDEENDPKNPSKRISALIHFLRYQPSIKNLDIQFIIGDGFLTDHYWKFERYPKTLERLSLQGVNFEKSIVSSFHHLKNLKHLELIFNDRNTGEFLFSILELVPKVSSHLQTLSLSWSDNLMPDLSSALKGMKTLKNLSQLSLDFQGGEANNLEDILQAFGDCTLSHLTLLTQVEFEEQLFAIYEFLQKFRNLESLKLLIKCRKYFDNSFGNIQEILNHIDNLEFLKNLSVSISLQSQKNHEYPELDSIFTNILRKAIPLDTFQVQIKPFRVSHQGFLGLLQSLRPLAHTLQKLRIDVGEHNKVNKNEFKTVLVLVKSLKNIRSLQLDSLTISLKQSFVDFANIILTTMPYLRTLVLGEVHGTVTKPIFMKVVEAIMKKKGLRRFDCHVSNNFCQILENRDETCPKLKLIEIQKVNPSFRKCPFLPIINFPSEESYIW